LYSSAFSVGNGVHAPIGVDVEDVDELVATFGVVVTTNGGEEGWDGDVGADDWVENPFYAEIGDAFEGVGEGVQAGDCDGVGWGHAFAREKAEEGCFACSVGCGGECGVSVSGLE